MPTHFLLTTEVRRPEDLEYADFLLRHAPQGGRGARPAAGHAGLAALRGAGSRRSFRDRCASGRGLPEAERQRRGGRGAAAGADRPVDAADDRLRPGEDRPGRAANSATKAEAAPGRKHDAGGRRWSRQRDRRRATRPRVATLGRYRRTPEPRSARWRCRSLACWRCVLGAAGADRWRWRTGPAAGARVLPWAADGGVRAAARRRLGRAPAGDRGSEPPRRARSHEAGRIRPDGRAMPSWRDAWSPRWTRARPTGKRRRTTTPMPARGRRPARAACRLRGGGAGPAPMAAWRCPAGRPRSLGRRGTAARLAGGGRRTGQSAVAGRGDEPAPLRQMARPGGARRRSATKAKRTSSATAAGEAEVSDAGARLRQATGGQARRPARRS